MVRRTALGLVPDSTHHRCADNSAVYYVRVRRADPAEPNPLCEDYALEISNGYHTGEPL